MIDDNENGPENRSAIRENPAEECGGYCKPPAAHQFRKGVSGNPRGRPKKRERAWSFNQLVTDILTEANRDVVVKTDGRSERIAMQKLILRRIFADAARGDKKLIKVALDLLGKAAVDRAKMYPKLYEGLEYSERDAVAHGPNLKSGHVVEFLDFQRKKSRQT